MSNDIFRQIVKDNADLYRKNEEYREKTTNDFQKISPLKKDKKTLNPQDKKDNKDL